MSQHTDIAEIRGMLETLLADDKKDAALELMISLVSQLKDDNDRLNARLARLLAHRFGHRSEKVSSGQLQLFLEQVEPPEAPADEPIPVPATA
jgi:hypothetical protein